MNKPTKQTKTCYDYHQCRNYLQDKYGYNERDYANRFKKPYNASAPYQDFWHFVLEMAPNITNGSFFVMDEYWLDEASHEWQKQILNYYLDEFGEYEDTGSRTIEFYIEW